jgi:type I restriction enzyme S subunit
MPTTNTTLAESPFKGTQLQENRRQGFIELGWWVSIPLTVVPSHWLLQGEQRLDGEYYAAEAMTALRIVNDCGFETKSLKNLVSELYILGRFRRIYATNTNAGWPYLSASEALEFRPVSQRYIATDHAPKEAKRHFAKDGWILVSSSGTVGRTVIVTKRLEKYFLTHDLIRVVPGKQAPLGYLYAYLSTRVGQALISKDQYGSAIKHLEPHHLASVPVPLLPDDEQQVIHEEIMRAFALRDEANDLLDEADELLHQELGLPRFDESLVPYLPVPNPEPSSLNRPTMPHPKAFSVNVLGLDERFDASYHVPVTRTAIEWLRKGKYEVDRLGGLANDIVVAPRFKRIYVPKEYGVPFLQGSHLPQMRPYDMKYLSRSQQKGLDRWIVRKGWVLVTCSGTIGRVGLVSSRQDQWAASQHLLRIFPDYQKGHPGYIAAFLATPYGQHQLTAKIYGGVVDEITAEDTANVWIPKAPPEVQAAIGAKVVSAYEKKDEARAIEEAAIKRLEAILEKRQEQ